MATEKQITYLKTLIDNSFSGADLNRADEYSQRLGGSRFLDDLGHAFDESLDHINRAEFYRRVSTDVKAWLTALDVSVLSSQDASALIDDLERGAAFAYNKRFPVALK